MKIVKVVELTGKEVNAMYPGWDKGMQLVITDSGIFIDGLPDARPSFGKGTLGGHWADFEGKTLDRRHFVVYANRQIFGIPWINLPE